MENYLKKIQEIHPNELMDAINNNSLFTLLNLNKNHQKDSFEMFDIAGERINFPFFTQEKYKVSSLGFQSDFLKNLGNLLFMFSLEGYSLYCTDSKDKSYAINKDGLRIYSKDISKELLRRHLKKINGLFNFNMRRKYGEYSDKYSFFIEGGLFCKSNFNPRQIPISLEHVCSECDNNMRVNINDWIDVNCKQDFYFRSNQRYVFTCPRCKIINSLTIK